MFLRGHDKRRKTEECVLLNLSGRSVADPGSVQIAAELHVTESYWVCVCVRTCVCVCVYGCRVAVSVWEVENK